MPCLHLRTNQSENIDLVSVMRRTGLGHDSNLFKELLRYRSRDERSGKQATSISYVSTDLGHISFISWAHLSMGIDSFVQSWMEINDRMYSISFVRKSKSNNRKWPRENTRFNRHRTRFPRTIDSHNMKLLQVDIDGLITRLHFTAQIIKSDLRINAAVLLCRHLSERWLLLLWDSLRRYHPHHRNVLDTDSVLITDGCVSISAYMESIRVSHEEWNSPEWIGDDRTRIVL